MTVDLRSRQRSYDGTPESGRLKRRIGEELSTMTKTSKRDDGEKLEKSWYKTGQKA